MSAWAFVVTWVLHGTVLGLVALLLPTVFRFRDPKALASWWGYAAGAIVLLPMLPLALPRPPAVPMPVTAFVETTTAALGPVFATAPTLSPLAWLGAAWTCGALVRLACVVAGHRRLRRLAERGTPIEGDPALDRARSLAPAAVLPPFAAGRVPVVAVADAGPCAFGYVRACVVVPVALRERPEEERLAVYLHELAHVARGDVSHGYAEEAWRLLWWWQPAVWLLFSRVRLAREHEVDALVVNRTGGMRAYVEALLWCSTLQPADMPGLPVGSRKHALVRRVALMCEGVTMSRTRRWITTTAMVGLVGGASGMVNMVSPLRAAQGGVPGVVTFDAGPLERAAVRPTLDMPAPRRTFAVEPAWNDDGVGYRFRVHLVIDAAGQVAEARVVRTSGIELAADGPSPRVGDARAAAMAAVRQWRFEAPVQAPMVIAADVVVGRSAAGAELYSPTPDSAARPLSDRPPIRAGGTVQPPRKIYDVKPEYPQAAIDAKITGVVTIEATVGVDGTIAEAEVLKGVPELNDAALGAVRQWRFEPVWLNGEAVPIIIVLTVNFTLK